MMAYAYLSESMYLASHLEDASELAVTERHYVRHLVRVHLHTVSMSITNAPRDYENTDGYPKTPDSSVGPPGNGLGS